VVGPHRLRNRLRHRVPHVSDGAAGGLGPDRPGPDADVGLGMQMLV
jgi:hypothetical protein